MELIYERGAFAPAFYDIITCNVNEMPNILTFIC